jgi:hypothetical protein
MKLKILILLTATLSLMAFAIKKPAEFKIKQTVNFLSGNKTEYFYDSIGRVSRVKNSKNITTTYLYYGNIIVKSISGIPNDKDVTDTFFLNNKNRAEKLTSSTGGRQQFEYDAKGHFIQAMEYGNDQLLGKNIWKWEGDNLKSTTSYDDEGKMGTSMVYYYFDDKPNTISQKYMGMEYMGQDSKNAIKETFATGWMTAKGDTIHTIYKYQFNEQGAIKIKAVYNKTGKLTDSIGYTYY